MANDAYSLNEVTLVGHLGRDAELNSAKNGTKYLNLNLATKMSRRAPSGEREEETTWHRVKMWGLPASYTQRNNREGVSDRTERLAKYLVKGTLVLVKGFLRYSEIEKDGVKSRYCEVVAENIIILDNKTDAQKSAPKAPQQRPQATRRTVTEEDYAEGEFF